MTFRLHPNLLLKIKRPLVPACWIISSGFFLWGIYLALVASPPDYQQNDMVRIMYVHVPAAWLAMGIYAFMAVMNLAGFVWRNLLAFFMAKAAAPIGLVFNLICIITGSLWGKPLWGAWWVWDARLTSMVILVFLYMGYLILIDAFEDRDQGLRMGAFLSLIGVINLPIIKWSVTWWNTLHQPASVFRIGGPTIHTQMLYPLGVLMVAFTALAISLILMRAEMLLMARQLRVLTLKRIREQV
jgi:heme exporter protein C